jgi:hypothetical protein
MAYLLGVMHNGEPPYSLKDMLSRIRHVSRIGIEYLSEEDLNEEYNYGKALNPLLEMNKSTAQFWEGIRQIISNHELIYLETIEQAKKQVMLTHQIYNEKMKVKEFLEKTATKEIWDISKKVFELEAERAILIGIEHDDVLIQKIKETNPEIVIIGRGHADYFFLEQEKIFGKQIFHKYDAEEYSNKELKMKEGRSPNAKDIAYRDNQKRLDKMLKTGLLTDEVPDYVGTWKTTNPYEGYFEVFIDENKIVDIIGTAKFKGNIKDKFIKEYIHSSNGTLDGEISYEVLTNSAGIIKGIYEKNHPFFMTKFKDKQSFENLKKTKLIQEHIRVELIDSIYSPFRNGQSGDYF